MKTFIHILSIFFLLSLQVSFLQAQMSWVGGTPGEETNWNQAANWSEGRVPDLNDHIRIGRTSTGFYPVVDGDTRPFATLLIEEGAEVRISPSGSMVIDNPPDYAYGLFLVGSLINQGNLMINDEGGFPIRGNMDMMKNDGMVLFLGSLSVEEIAGE